MRYKYFYWPIFVISTLLVAIGSIMEYRAVAELKHGRNYILSEDVEKAMTHYSRALHWYLPWGSSETAAEELLEIGLRLAGEGNEEVAMRALLRVRSGLYGARWLVVPRMDLIRRAEPVLADILAREKLGHGSSLELYESQKAEYLSLLQEPPRPALLPTIAASFGFLLWVTSVFLFIFRFFGNKNSGWSRSWPWIFVMGVGFGIWLWGMKWS